MSKSEAVQLRPLMGIACGGLFVFGIVMALLGAILPSLAERLRFSVADIGTLFLAMNFAMLACSLVLGVVMDRFGMRLPLVIGPLLVGAALLLIVRAEVFGALFPAVLLLGIGGGAVNGGANTLAADLYDDPNRKSSALNTVGIFFGIGALSMPFAIGALLARFSLSTLLVAAALLCVLLGAVAALLQYPAPKQAHRLPVAEMPRFLRSPFVVIFAALLFFESGIEFTLGGFISTYMSHDMAVSSVSMASWILAGYWAAIIVSRILLSRVALSVEPFRILSLCAAGACAGVLLAALAPGVTGAVAGVWLAGFALAGIYPTVLGIAGARYRSHSGTVFGILFAVALVGGMLLPWGSGLLGAGMGLRYVFGFIASCFVVIFGLGRLAARQ